MRLDVALVERGLVHTRTLAQMLILSGSVRKNGEVVRKPSLRVGESDLLETTYEPPYVSRGGVKLASALEHFQIDPGGKTCLDVGASTGGFTDCLLQHGARRVYAFDSGSDQLAQALKNDDRVVWRENFNARYLEPHDIGEEIQLVVVDVSFISITLILPAVARVLKTGDVIALIKPQFEVGRENLGKGGIVRDETLHQASIAKVKTAALDVGFIWRSVVASPIEGGDGNHEFLARLQRDER